MSSNAVSDELVSQFMAFTGSADATKAVSYLEMSSGNVETAVSLYMDHEQTGGGGSSSGGAAAHLSSPQEIRAPDETRTMRLMDDSGGMMMHHHDPSFQMMSAMMEEEQWAAQSAFAAPPPPFMHDVRAAVNAAAAVSAREMAARFEAAQMGDQESKDNSDDESMVDGEQDGSEDDVQVLASSAPTRLSDMFAPPTHLIHKAGGFLGARTMAKDTKRWLLVNIQRDSEFSSHALNRDVWRNELVENLIREGFIFWQQMDVQPEGRTYTERYQVADYPHVGIIDPRTGRLMWRKEGWTMEKPLTAALFSEMAMDFCSRNSFTRPPQAPRGAAPAAAPSRPAKRPMDEMTEEEQLQAAMRASMQDATTNSTNQAASGNVDSDNSVEYINDDSDGEDAAADDDAKPAATASPNQDFVAMAMGDEPATGARIQLRMPDGKRVVRKFANADTVKSIYAFVAQTNDDAREGKEFVLMAGFPPSDLMDCIDHTIEASSLSGQAVSVRWK